MLLSAGVWVGCAGKHRDSRLDTAYKLTSENPDSALELLKNIDRKALSNSDRHYYDFVLIKGRDKGYITHTSDSLYLSVLEYAEHHQHEGWYPEALYYGGRVYSDLGDLPSALKYFHQSLDLLPADGTRDQQYLRGIVLSQTGRLLDKLRMHKAAIPYIEESLHYDSLYNDKVNLISDLQLLSAIFIRDSQMELSRQCLIKALTIKPQTAQDSAKSYLYLANYYQLRTERDSSIYYILKALKNSYKEVENCTNLYAATIFRDADMPDSAFLYAQRVIKCNEDNYKVHAYRILLSPKMRDLLPTDSLDIYFDKYFRLLEKRLDENQSNLSVSQQSFYNYANHYKLRLIKEKENSKLRSTIAIISIISLGLVLLIMYFKSRRNEAKLRLIIALDKIAVLNELEIRRYHSKNSSVIETNQEKYFENQIENINRFYISSKLNSIEDLRKKLQGEIMSRCQNISVYNECMEFKNSEIWNELIGILQDDRSIKAKDEELWNKIDRTVKESSIDFRKKLELLTNYRLTEDEYRTSLLIKLGMTPTQISRLLLKTKGTISSRRDRLCQKMFDTRMGVEFVDKVIKSL